VIGIDTNVLIRYIIQDNPLQSALATEFLEKNCTPEDPGYLHAIVLCELDRVGCAEERSTSSWLSVTLKFTHSPRASTLKCRKHHQIILL
jgi:predicted nucleic acid-binding protein